MCCYLLLVEQPAVGILIAVFAIAGPTAANDRSPAPPIQCSGTDACRVPPFDMEVCLKAVEPIFTPSPEERQAVCDDMRAGV